MEETVWMYYAVIAIIFALGIVGILVARNAEDSKEQHLQRSLQELQVQCNYVCGLGVGTALDVEVVLPSGARLYTRDYKICTSFRGSSRCEICNCALSEYELNLNSSFALNVFDSHEYACFFTRTAEGEKIECQG